MKFDGPDFRCHDRVSIWISEVPYSDIPDSYFDEDFSCKNGAPVNEWAGNYGFGFYNEQRLATNGAEEGTISLQDALAGCSFADSFLDAALAEAKTQQVKQVTWVILLYDFDFDTEHQAYKDQYTRFLGAFDYDENS